MKRLLLLTVFFLGYSQLERAQNNLAQLKVTTTKTDVLAGRLKLSVPNQAMSRPMQRGIMAAPESDSEQTRIMIDAGEQRMVLMAYEPFARVRADLDDLEGPAQKLPKHFPVKVKFQKWSLAAPFGLLLTFLSPRLRIKRPTL